MKTKLLVLVVLFSSLFLASSAFASPYSQRTCSDGWGNSLTITISEGYVDISSFGFALSASIGHISFCYPIFYGQAMSLEIEGYSESELIYYDVYSDDDGWQCTKDWSFTITEGIPTVKVYALSSFDSIPFGRSSVSCSLMSKYEDDPGPSPIITITSPNNCTNYPICSNSSYYKQYVLLNFEIDEPVFPFTTKYSLDNEANVTIDGPIALSSILDADYPITNGFHSITVYANDLLGNQEKSNTIYFFYCLGDVNGDKKINVLDSIILSSNFGKTTSIADLNGDGRVNILDSIILSKNFGRKC